MMCCAGLPSPVMLLFNKPIRDLLPQMHKEPININNDDAEYEAIKVDIFRTMILTKNHHVIIDFLTNRTKSLI